MKNDNLEIIACCVAGSLDEHFNIIELDGDSILVEHDQLGKYRIKIKTS